MFWNLGGFTRGYSSPQNRGQVPKCRSKQPWRPSFPQCAQKFTYIAWRGTLQCRDLLFGMRTTSCCIDPSETAVDGTALAVPFDCTSTRFTRLLATSNIRHGENKKQHWSLKKLPNGIEARYLIMLATRRGLHHDDPSQNFLPIRLWKPIGQGFGGRRPWTALLSAVAARSRCYWLLKNAVVRSQHVFARLGLTLVHDWPAVLTIWSSISDFLHYLSFPLVSPFRRKPMYLRRNGTNVFFRAHNSSAIVC